MRLILSLHVQTCICRIHLFLSLGRTWLAMVHMSFHTSLPVHLMLTCPKKLLPPCLWLCSGFARPSGFVTLVAHQII